jgi:hypothetical protein
MLFELKETCWITTCVPGSSKEKIKGINNNSRIYFALFFI